MAYLVSDVLDRVRQSLPGFYLNTEPEALRLVNDANVDVALQCGMYPFQDETVTLVAGTREYLLDADIFQIASATYYTASSSWFPLRPTSVDKLDYRNIGWRDDSAGTPFEFYENGGYVGFYQTPNTTTAISGYPKVILSVRRGTPFTSVDDPLPAHAPRIDAWVYAVCLRWAVDHEPSRVPEFAALAKSALNDLKSFTLGKLMRQRPAVRPRFQTPRNR